MWGMRSLMRSPLRCPPRMSYIETRASNIKQRSKETGWNSTTPCRSPGKKGHELQIRKQNSSHTCEHWELHSLTSSPLQFFPRMSQIEIQTKPSTSKQKQRMEFYNTMSTPRKHGDEPKLRYQKSSHVCEHWGLHSLMSSPLRFSTRLSWIVLHHNNIKNINNRLFQTYTPSCPTLPAGALWDLSIQWGYKSFAGWWFQNLFVGSCHVRPDWRIGKLLSYLQQENGMEFFGGPNQVSTDSSGQKDRDSWRKVRVAFTTH